LEFCEKCGKLKMKTSVGLKCEKCDDLSQIPKKVTENKTEILSDGSFPFEKEKYYEQNLIRKLIAHPQWGIYHNQEGDYWVIIKNKKSETNTYDDRMDKDGLYRYTGQGLSGDQNPDSANNLGLKNAESNGQKIHLFWQDNQNSKHKYIGEVKVVKTDDDEKQRGADGYPRNVIVFTLLPI